MNPNDRQTRISADPKLSCKFDFPCKETIREDLLGQHRPRIRSGLSRGPLLSLLLLAAANVNQDSHKRPANIYIYTNQFTTQYTCLGCFIEKCFNARDQRLYSFFQKRSENGIKKIGLYCLLKLADSTLFFFLIIKLVL